MASVLDWAYWHLARDTPRRVLDGSNPVLKYISPGQLPPGKPARQVAMSILRGSSFEPFDGDPLAGWHRVTLGVDARAEPEETADPAEAESPGEWCHDVLTADPRQPAVVQRGRCAGDKRRDRGRLDWLFVRGFVVRERRERERALPFGAARGIF